MKVYFDQTVIDDECNINRVTYYEIETHDISEYIGNYIGFDPDI